MATVTPDAGTPDNLRELLQQLGDVPPERVRMRPLPGAATEDDVLAAEAAPRKRLCELIDGVLVEKAMGTKEALLAMLLGHILLDFVEKQDLGTVLGADGMLRLFPGQVRIPDVSYISWDRLPGRSLPDEPIAGVVPDLAVEVLSEGNTKGEMGRKLRDYFVSGVRCVWVIDPRKPHADLHHSPEYKRRIDRKGTLESEEVLPGFALPFDELFDRAARRGARFLKKKRK